MKMVYITLKEGDNETIIINADHIITVRAQKEGGTELEMINGRRYWIKETIGDLGLIPLNE